MAKKKNTGSSGQLEFDFNFDEIAKSMQKIAQAQTKIDKSSKAQLAIEQAQIALETRKQSLLAAQEKTKQAQLKTKGEMLKNQEKEVGLIEKAAKAEGVRLQNSNKLLQNEKALVALEQQKQKYKINDEKLKREKQTTKEFKAGEGNRAAMAEAQLRLEDLKAKELEQRMELASKREYDRQTDRTAKNEYYAKREAEREAWKQEKDRRDKEREIKEEIREKQKEAKTFKQNFNDIRTITSFRTPLSKKIWAARELYYRNPSIWHEAKGGSPEKARDAKVAMTAVIAASTALGMFTGAIVLAIKAIKFLSKAIFKIGLAVATAATAMAIGAFKGASSIMRTGDITNMRYGDILAAQMGGKLNGLGEDGLLSMIRQQGTNINNISSTGAYATVGLNREDLSKLNGIDRFFYTMDAFLERTNEWGEHATKNLAPDLGLDWETVLMFKNNPKMYDRLKNDTMSRANRYGGIGGGLEEGERIIKQFHEQLKLIGIEISGKLLPTISLVLSEAAPLIRSFMNGFATLVQAVFTKENIRKLKQSFDDLRKEMSNAWKRIFDQQTMKNIGELGSKLGDVGKGIKNLVFNDQNYDWVKEQINKVINSFKEIDFDNFKTMFKKLGGILQEVVNVLTSAFDTFLKGAEFFAALFTLDPVKIMEAMKKFGGSAFQLAKDTGAAVANSAKILLTNESTMEATEKAKSQTPQERKQAFIDAQEIFNTSQDKKVIKARELLAKQGFSAEDIEGIVEWIRFSKSSKLTYGSPEYQKALEELYKKYPKIIQRNQSGSYSPNDALYNGKWFGTPLGDFENILKLLGLDDIVNMKMNDGVITKDGRVVKTSPEDYIFATKTPEKLANAGGYGNITINVGSVRDDRDINEIRRVVDRLVRQMAAMRV